MKKYPKKVIKSLLNLIYPPLCLHCSDIRAEDCLLCSSCTSLLELIDPRGRCSTCFREGGFPEGRKCEKCLKYPSSLYKLAASFEYMGPVASLVRNLKYQDQTYLAKGLAGFIVAQLLKLDWPFPDLIIPVPMAWVRLMDRGFNQSALIAHYVSINLERPMQELLIRKNGDYSQAGLSRLQRTRLDSSSFSLKQGAEIKDKTILIIDDVMTTGTTIHHCANALAEGLPKNIYGLTVCKA